MSLSDESRNEADSDLLHVNIGSRYNLLLIIWLCLFGFFLGLTFSQDLIMVILQTSQPLYLTRSFTRRFGLVTSSQHAHYLSLLLCHIWPLLDKRHHFVRDLDIHFLSFCMSDCNSLILRVVYDLAKKVYIKVLLSVCLSLIYFVTLEYF